MTTCNNYKDNLFFLIYLKSETNQRQDTLPAAITATATQTTVTFQQLSTIHYILYKKSNPTRALKANNMLACTGFNVYTHENLVS